MITLTVLGLGASHPTLLPNFPSANLHKRLGFCSWSEARQSSKLPSLAPCPRTWCAHAGFDWLLCVEAQCHLLRTFVSTSAFLQLLLAECDEMCSRSWQMHDKMCSHSWPLVMLGILGAAWGGGSLFKCSAHSCQVHLL